MKSSELYSFAKILQPAFSGEIDESNTTQIASIANQ